MAAVLFEPAGAVGTMTALRGRPEVVEAFTGALSMRRQEAWDAVAACGAVVEKGVTKRTTLLVVGDGFTGHDPADFWTGKAAKATRWREKSHRIEVLTEGDLVDLLAETRTSGVREPVLT